MITYFLFIFVGNPISCPMSVHRKMSEIDAHKGDTGISLRQITKMTF